MEVSGMEDKKNIARSELIKLGQYELTEIEVKSSGPQDCTRFSVNTKFQLAWCILVLKAREVFL